jgi:hypothetical protein
MIASALLFSAARFSRGIMFSALAGVSDEISPFISISAICGELILISLLIGAKKINVKKVIKKKSLKIILFL